MKSGSRIDSNNRKKLQQLENDLFQAYINIFHLLFFKSKQIPYIVQLIIYHPLIRLPLITPLHLSSRS